MNKKGLIAEMENFGRIDLIGWMRDEMLKVEGEFESIYKKGTSVYHIDVDNIDNFKKSVESYIKDHPDAKIKASAFLISSEEPTKEYTIEK